MFQASVLVNSSSLLRIFWFLITVFATLSLQANSLKGLISDVESGEMLTGVHVWTQSKDGKAIHAISGLDGSYKLDLQEAGKYEVHFSFISYREEIIQITLEPGVKELVRDIALQPDLETLGQVEVVAEIRGSDVQARMVEKLSPNVVSVISSKQIELSPDITVANVIQRVSGLSIERNASGDPQYAIVRGMDKRYNNTLVNGIKIPSPDNENRYVPLDIFPAVFLERLEVYKSLTANMEADAIGGTVNMIMRSAPNGFLLDGDLQIGYNQMNLARPFGTYDRSQLDRLSPKERFGEEYRATPDDFPTQNMTLQEIQPLPDVFLNLSIGNRYLNNRLGLMAGVSLQNSYRPVSNYFYDPAVNNAEGNPLIMRELIRRETSSQLQRIAFHTKLDYTSNPAHRFSLYLGHYMLNEFRVRDQLRQESFVAVSNYAIYPITRFSNIFQSISTIDFRAEHDLSVLWKADWTLVFSRASNDRPDDGVFSRAGQFDVDSGTVNNEIVYFQGTRNSRAWERNTDTDVSAYFNFKYQPGIINEKTEIHLGGVLRNKLRDNYFNYYNYAQIFGQFRDVHWFEFGDINFVGMANPLGSGDKSNLVYDASEQIAAAYANSIWEFGMVRIQAGLRMEHTIQAYEINADAASNQDLELSQKQNYTHLFPAISLKHGLNPKANLKATYFKGISRPGFYEIVPTIRSNGGGDSFYSERGNADLRPSIGHSFDLRYEYFPTGAGQVLFGVFYKSILDPIEYGFPQVEEGESVITNRILPQNFDDAINYGVEFDLRHYWNRLGVRANYTYTKSTITTNKIVLEDDGSAQLVNQSRSLQGQSDHIANLSLLWKDAKHRLDAQLVLNYTGERIAVVSPYLDADHYMLPMTQLDFSIEKGISKGWVVFVKVNNILNTPYQLVIKKPLAVPDDPYPFQTNPYEEAYVRRDIFGESIRLGIRYNFALAQSQSFLTKP